MGDDFRDTHHAIKDLKSQVAVLKTKPAGGLGAWLKAHAVGILSTIGAVAAAVVTFAIN